MDEKTIQKLNAGISAVFVIAAALLFGAALKNRKTQEAPASTTEASEATGETGMQAYDDLAGMQELELAKDFASWTPDAHVEDEKVRTATLQASGKVAKAYLAVRASVDGKPLTKYESVFVKFNDDGGHLFRPMTLETPAAESATSLLFDLSDLPVLPSVPYDETRTPDRADLSALLAAGKPVKLTAFISSLRPALLEDLSLSYVCQEGEDCSVTLR